MECESRMHVSAHALVSVFQPSALRFGQFRLRLSPWSGPAVVVDGLVRDDGGPVAPADYVNAILLQPECREEFFALVDRVGLVVCKNVGGDDHAHRDVRGRSSRGRLSQGEYYHHDGCSSPTKPRVVEIRCPFQELGRHTATAIAAFPSVLYAMLLELPAELRATGELAALHERVSTGGALLAHEWDSVQGALNRTVRRALRTEQARAYFRGVDARVGAYREPWTMGECRFIANSNNGRTMQHRRAYLDVHAGGRPNGKLVKRWPADPELELKLLADSGLGDEPCARGACFASDAPGVHHSARSQTPENATATRQE